MSLFGPADIFSIARAVHRPEAQPELYDQFLAGGMAQRVLEVSDRPDDRAVGAYFVVYVFDDLHVQSVDQLLNH